MCGQINRYFVKEVKETLCQLLGEDADSESIMEFCYKVNIKGAIAHKLRRLK